MKYSELKQKATQGEWSKHSDDFIMDEDHWLQTQYIRANKGDTVVALTTECHGYWTPEQVKANAALIVHQHEHFDKLLEALKEARDTLVLTRLIDKSGESETALYAVEKAIEAAQTVKEL